MPKNPGDLSLRLKRHLPRSNNLLLIVLKGHLLMEEGINSLLENSVTNPSALFPLHGISLANRIKFMASLAPGPMSKRIARAAEKLNTLRNKFAHQLEPAQVENLIEKFLDELEDTGISPEERRKVPLHSRLRSGITYLCAALAGIGDAHIALKGPKTENFLAKLK